MDKVIHILGSGPMGLGVAYQLIKKGYKPLIFEADDRIGGMTASFDFNGIDIERFYHFHCKTDDAFFQILKELDLTTKFHWQKTKMGFWYKNKIHPWATPIDLLKFPDLNFIQKLRYALHAFISTKRSDWKSLDQINARDWLIKSLGYQTYEILWKKLFDLKFYQYANKVSAAWIWSRIKRTGLSRKNMFQEELGYLEGGSQTLLDEMKNFILKNGGKIKLKSKVNLVNIENNRIKNLIINGKKISSNKVISTIPIPYVNKIIPDLPILFAKKYDQIKNIGVVCVIAKLKKNISKHFWLNINDPKMDIPGIIEYTNLRKISNISIAYIPFYMPQDNKKFKDEDSVFVSKVIRYIQKLNPNIRKDDFIDIKVNRYFYSQPVCEINHAELLPPIKTTIEGLFIADTSFYYPEDRGISESIKLGKKIVEDYF